MEKKRLLLITNYYPFYKGEEYIENEIDIASKTFDEIIIVPTMKSLNMEQTRKVPDNVTVIGIATDCSIIGKIKLLLKGFLPLVKNKDLRGIMTNKEITLKQKVYSIYYMSRVWAVYRNIINNTFFKEKLAPSQNVFIYSYWLHVTASIAARLKKYYFNQNVCSVARGHRYDLYDYAAPFKYVPDREFMLSHMDMVYPCSDDGTNYLVAQYPEYASSIKTQRLGTMLHEPIKCERIPVFCLVSCAVVRPVKRLDKIINVVKILTKKGYKVQWTHLGGGPFYNEMVKEANAVLPEDTFHFAGQMTNEEVYNWYQNNSVSCFINLSDSEGVPVSIMEAMGFGIPIVATGVGGSREIVEHNVNGVVISDHENETSIADKIERLINMGDEDFHSLCLNSYKIWNEKCNAVSLYTHFYQELVNLYEKTDNRYQ